MDGDGDLMDDVPCSSIAVDSVLRIGSAGAIWGLCVGPYDARKRGLVGTSRSLFVVKSAGSIGLQCGLFAGIYSGTRCGIQRYRRKKDPLNASIAGAVAGAAIAARTRRWMQVFGTAALVSAITTAIEVGTGN
ncbi:hypothetical protein Syun_007931 [Stephania yunnanensis]|uniref:Outer envelope pore protein 16-4, chloroplastic n=1 Tax=Stephania yunnanensis TaxID=152371 RepID=A0AAP0PZR3_9MAGN